MRQSRPGAAGFVQEAQRQRSFLACRGSPEQQAIRPLDPRPRIIAGLQGYARGQRLGHLHHQFAVVKEQSLQRRVRIDAALARLIRIGEVE